MPELTDLNPILVVVGRQGYECFSLAGPVATLRDQELFALLQKQGGVSDTVAPGSYHFNALPGKGNLLVLTLLPAE